MPDILDQLTICVGAGLGLDGALQRVVWSNEHDPLADELGVVLRDIRVGVPRHEALIAMATRVGLPELRTVVRAVNQSDKAGLPVGRVLRVQADDVRERRRLRAEETAMRMPVKLIFPLVLCILPALFVVLMGPAALRLASNGIAG
jgi:tight adherence protein C